MDCGGSGRGSSGKKDKNANAAAAAGDKNAGGGGGAVSRDNQDGKTLELDGVISAKFGFGRQDEKEVERSPPVPSVALDLLAKCVGKVVIIEDVKHRMYKGMLTDFDRRRMDFTLTDVVVTSPF